MPPVPSRNRAESLIRTPAIDEAVAYLEAFLDGLEPDRLWIVGPPGSGKSFLAQWGKRQNVNGRRAGLIDGSEPDPILEAWACFVREDPDDPRDGLVVRLQPPEYERKVGVLREWATARGLTWQDAALRRLTAVTTDNLQLLRSIAERTALESLLPNPEIREVDVLRTLGRLGYLRMHR